MEKFKILPAVTFDAKQLTEIAFKSKRHWDYPEEWISGWKEDLTITSDYIGSNYVFKLIEIPTDRICGFCAIEYEGERIEIAHMWLDPAFMGRGLGNYLLAGSLEKVAHLEPKEIFVISDPNALGFYSKFGFVKVGEIESTPAGRFLPKLVYTAS